MKSPIPRDAQAPEHTFTPCHSDPAVAGEESLLLSDDYDRDASLTLSMTTNEKD